MIGLIYGLIAAGYCHETDSIWQAVVWPLYLGKAIARATLPQEEATNEQA